MMGEKTALALAKIICKIETGANYDDLSPTNGDEDIDMRKEFLKRARRILDDLDEAGFSVQKV